MKYFDFETQFIDLYIGPTANELGSTCLVM